MEDNSYLITTIQSKVYYNYNWIFKKTKKGNLEWMVKTKFIKIFSSPKAYFKQTKY